MSAGFLLHVLRKRRRQRRDGTGKHAVIDEEAQQAALPLPVDSSGSGGGGNEGQPQPPVSSPQGASLATPATEAQRLWERFRRVSRSAIRVLAF